MRRSIATLLEEAKGKMSGYVMLANYKYMNLCVKAEPASLLCITVEYEGDKYNLEKLVNVARSQEDQFELYPKNNTPALLFAICKGVTTAHPEFKCEVVNLDDDEKGDDEEEKKIRLTMPEIDKNRHDIISNGVDGLQKECQAKLDTLLQDYTQKSSLKLAGAQPEELDEIKDALQDLHDKHQDLLESYSTDKKKEVDEAYKKYQAKEEEKKKEQEEKASAHNESAGRQMRMENGKVKIEN